MEFSALALVVAVVMQGFNAGQPPLRVGRPVIDSAQLVRSARSAQFAFEAFRRARLPRGEGRPGPCDATIGRYCYWRGDDDDDDTPAPPEAPSIRERREELIRLLDSASRALPGDPWLAGQRARYLVESGDTARARVAVTQCMASKRWCHALAGYVAHVTGAYARADSAYRRALDAMESAERCRWLDISALIDGDLARRYETLDCAGRERLARRAFALAAPLYMISGSDLFTEHLARLTRTRTAEGAATVDGESWADDARQLVLRYGWPSWYSRSEPPIGADARVSVTGHDSGRPYYLMPSLPMIEHPGKTAADDWRLDDSRAPSGYTPASARSIHDLPHQIARFRHGDTTYVVAGWAAERDTSIGRAADAALVLTSDLEVQPFTVIAGARSGSAAAWVVADSGLVSIEVLDRDARHAARARVGFAPPGAGRLRLSDLLLYKPWSANTPLGANAALAEHAVRTEAVSARDTTAVYWETYGLRVAGEPLHYALAFEQIGVSWARRAAERLHLSDRTSGVRVTWSEVPLMDGDRAGRGVRVDLSRLLGRYRMQLTVSAEGDATATSVREVVVR